MSSTKSLLLVGAVLLVTAGCTLEDPEFSANDQVAAADRIEEVPEGEEGGAAAPEGPVLEYAAGADLDYDVAPETAPAGDVTVSITCESLGHNVVFEGVDGETPIAECTGPGTDTGSTTLPPGEAVYYCSIPGHRAGGMEGTLTVE